jgi:hypothetical protein
MNDLSKYISLLAGISVAAERLVEIIKGLIPWLAKENPDPDTELRRKAMLQALAAIAGIVTVLIASTIPELGLPKSPAALVVLGLLSSGGSGLWNAVLDYLKAIKDIKQQQVTGN